MLFCVILIDCKQEVNIKDKCYEGNGINFDTCYTTIAVGKVSLSDSIKYKGKFRDTIWTEYFIKGRDTTLLENVTVPPPPDN